jgi:hypothetical protein
MIGKNVEVHIIKQYRYGIKRKISEPYNLNGTGIKY